MDFKKLQVTFVFIFMSGSDNNALNDSNGEEEVGSGGTDDGLNDCSGGEMGLGDREEDDPPACLDSSPEGKNKYFL
jgi:hypothetical protein